MDVARRVAGACSTEARVRRGRLSYWLGGSHLRAAAQFPRDVAHPRRYTAGEAIGPTSSSSTIAGHQPEADLRPDETCVMVCVQPNGQVKPTRSARHEGRRGPPPRQRRDRPQEPGLFVEYHQNEEATGSQGCRGGTHRRRGYFDADGHLKIIDRAKDVGKLRAARSSRPSTREQAQVLRRHQGAVAFGDSRPRSRR